MKRKHSTNNAKQANDVEEGKAENFDLEEMEERSDDDSSDSEGDGVESESEGGDISSSVDEDDISEDDSDSDSDLNTGVEERKSSNNLELPAQKDEYEFDSSDEEDIRNTVGNVPMQWYKDYDHIGYDLSGKKIMKPGSSNEIDDFLAKMDDPNYWRTVKDKLTGQSVVLSDKDTELIEKLKAGRTADPDASNPYAPWIDFFTHEVMKHPLTNQPRDKRSFIPSYWEKIKVGKMVHAIKMGWSKPKIDKEKTSDDEAEGFKYYDLWAKSDDNQKPRFHIPAPKMTLPGHSESYNPAPEYLFTEKEKEDWLNQEPEERRVKFEPKKYENLRTVPAYTKFVNERFQRCLDLYLCPRQRKMKLNVDPNDLIPKLPSPRELQPYPSVQSLIYKGHESLIRSISVHPLGQWLVSGSDDGTVKIWEVSTARCLKTLSFDGKVKRVAFNPNSGLSLIAVAVNKEVIIFNSLIGDKVVRTNTDSIFESFENGDATNDKVEWKQYSGKDHDNGLRLKISHVKDVADMKWHVKGDYLGVVLPNAEKHSVCIHQISKRRSQHPFKKPKGLVQCIAFHPTRPFFFVATQRYVRVYNLAKQELIKKCMSNCKWLSSLDIHPKGDNLIAGSYDRRLCWFDLDMSTKPYKNLRHHKKAIRSVAFHRTYPLFASVSDDCTAIVCHGQVYSDLMTNALIVPLKILRGHASAQGLGVLDCAFHPFQPWLFTSGADGTVRLYTS